MSENTVPATELKLSQILSQMGYQFGDVLSNHTAALDIKQREYIDGKFAVLAGEDERINGVISTLLSITDAKPDTPEYDQGINLYKLIETKYTQVIADVLSNKNEITALKKFASDTTAAISNFNTAISEQITTEVTRAKAAETNLQTQINANKEALASIQAAQNTTKADFSAVHESLKAESATLKEKLTTCQVNITTLQNSLNDHESRIQRLESFFVGFGANTVKDAVAEFSNGLSGMPSGFGFQAS